MHDIAFSIKRTVVLATIVGAFLSYHAGAVTITEYPVPSASSSPGSITRGSDGALWFTAGAALGGSIWRVTTAGAFTEYPLLCCPPGPPFLPGSITPGSDGALWFTAVNGGGPERVEQITTAGVITSKFDDFGDAGLGGLTTGPDGALWLADPVDPRHTARIWRIPVNGAAPIAYGIPFDASHGPYPVGIAAGSDGALWFTGSTWFSNDRFIGRITTGGAVTGYLLPAGSNPGGITAGPDGALWFTEGSIVSGSSTNKIGRITTGGVITEYPIPTPNAGAGAITTGPDGALWFTESYANQIGRITTAGAITEYPIPTPSSTPGGITTGPDGALWFTESSGNKIGRLVPDSATIPAMMSFLQNLTQLNQGEQNSLMAKLNAAGNSVGKPACNQLDAFINEVNAMLQNGRLDASTAKALITGVQAIQASLGCSS